MLPASPRVYRVQKLTIAIPHDFRLGWSLCWMLLTDAAVAGSRGMVMMVLVFCGKGSFENEGSLFAKYEQGGF